MVQSLCNVALLSQEAALNLISQFQEMSAKSTLRELLWVGINY